MRIARLGVTLFAVLAAVAPPVRGTAAAPPGAAATPGRVTEGTLFWRAAGRAAPVPAPALTTDVDMRVTGPVVRAVVRQEFVNPSAAWTEGVYVFPLPDDAAVDHLRMRVGERTIEGVIREREAARAGYVRARAAGAHASLVEQERPNVFTTSVANIPPGASVVVEIEYQQLARFADGRFRLRFPLVVGPRYIPGSPVAGATGTGWAPDTEAVPDASRITPPVRDPARGPVNPVSIRVELDPGLPLARIESPYHAIDVAPLVRGRYAVALADERVPADRDFELAWEPAAGAAPAAAMVAEDADGESFALLMVLAPRDGADAEPRRPREVTLVIDSSGSMAGASIEQARAALKLALARLGPEDTVNVVRFSDTTDAVFAAPRPATASALRAAARYVDAIRASGGTEMLPALARALAPREPDGRLAQVIFLTDGAVGDEERLFALIRERLGERRLFTIGIGSAPNSHFMREAARLGRGTFTYIGRPGEVRASMDALLQKLEAPALTDVRLELDTDAEVLPAPIPDLYLGEPLTVVLRARALPTHATLRGRLGPTPWRRELELQPTPAGAGLATQWARQRIAALTDARRTGAAADEVRRAAVALALRHHLVSAYTSLVALDVTPARPDGAPLVTHALETNLPAGWQYEAVFGLGQGATDGPVRLIVGAGALLLAAALLGALRRLGRAGGPRGA